MKNFNEYILEKLKINKDSYIGYPKQRYNKNDYVLRVVYLPEYLPNARVYLTVNRIENISENQILLSWFNYDFKKRYSALTEYKYNKFGYAAPKLGTDEWKTILVPKIQGLEIINKVIEDNYIINLNELITDFDTKVDVCETGTSKHKQISKRKLEDLYDELKNEKNK